MDSDDVWNERKLEKQMNKYRENRYLSLVYTKRTFIDDKSNIIRCDDSKKIHGKVTNKLLIKNFIPMSSVLIDREVFNMVGVFNPMYNLLGDYDMWVKISIVGYIDCVDEKMLNDRVHIGSTTIRNRNKWIIEQRFFYFNFLRKYKLKYLSVVYYVVRTELANIIRKYLVNK